MAQNQDCIADDDKTSSSTSTSRGSTSEAAAQFEPASCLDQDLATTATWRDVFDISHGRSAAVKTARIRSQRRSTLLYCLVPLLLQLRSAICDRQHARLCGRLRPHRRSRDLLPQLPQRSIRCGGDWRRCSSLAMNTDSTARVCASARATRPSSQGRCVGKRNEKTKHFFLVIISFLLAPSDSPFPGPSDAGACRNEIMTVV